MTTSYHSIPLIQSPLRDSGKARSPVDVPPEIETHDETIFDNPQFQHYEETSNIQLFFDLFFVANLTSFTNAHEVNSTGSPYHSLRPTDIQNANIWTELSSYIGFFSILWFTWCQVTLYDVRFSTDSIFERIAHACHFGVMIGLAVVGPQFDDPKNSTPWPTLQQLSLILMASRSVLFFQYSSTVYFSWRYRMTRLPLMLVLTSLGIAIILYLSLSFAFSLETSSNAYLAWYAISVFEVGANIAIAGRWHVLGEGVIGLTKSITKIELLDFNFSRGAIGTIIAAVLAIYFVYQLYFDNIQLEHFGTIRQQIWTFLHFPFHMALVLLMEGINQFVSWRHITEYIGSTFDLLDSTYSNATATQQDIYNAWNATVDEVLNNPYLPVTEDVWYGIVDDLLLLSPSSNATNDQQINATQNIQTKLFKIIFDGYDFEPPETDETTTRTLDEVWSSYYSVFEFVFGYFSICAGLVLMFIGVLSWFSCLKGEVQQSRHRYIGIISNFALGLALTLLSVMVLTQSADNLGESVWTLPLLVFVLAIALALNHIPRRMK